MIPLLHQKQALINRFMEHLREIDDIIQNESNMNQSSMNKLLDRRNIIEHRLIDLLGGVI